MLRAEGLENDETARLENSSTSPSVFSSKLGPFYRRRYLLYHPFTNLSSLANFPVHMSHSSDQKMRKRFPLLFRSSVPKTRCQYIREMSSYLSTATSGGNSERAVYNQMISFMNIFDHLNSDTLGLRRKFKTINALACLAV